MKIKGFTIKAALSLCLVITTLLILSVVVYVQNGLKQPIGLAEKQLYTVKKGQSLSHVCQDFEAKGWISDCYSIKAYNKLTNDFSDIKSGTYWLAPDMTLQSSFELFKSGKEAQFGFTLIEGQNAYQVLAALQDHPQITYDLPALENNPGDLTRAAQFLNIETQSIEGLLAPDTYYFNAGAKASDILRRAIKIQTERLDEVWKSRQYTKHLTTPYEMLILASIVEKESSLHEERATIASVFFNRFDRRMRLQTDPTVIYGVWHEYHGDIKRVHLKTKTPYNTYKMKGLPPTPIANPSLASLQAVASPEQTDFLYFVASGTGGHTFSKTLAEHNKALKKYLAWQKAQKKK